MENKPLQPTETAPMESALPPTPEASGNGVSSAPPVSGLAADIAAKHGAEQPGAAGDQPTAVKRKPGRPAIHGLYSKANGSNGHTAVKLAGPGQVEPLQTDSRPPVRRPIPPGLLARVTKQTIGTAEKFALLQLASKAQKAGLTKEEIEPQIKQATLGDENKEILAELAPHICEEWGIDPELSPSVMAGAILIPYVGSFGMAMWTLSSLAAERALKDKRP